MAKRIKTNNDFYVNHVADPISGRKKLISIIEKNIGLDYGWRRAILFDNFVFFLGTANQNYTGSRITGSISNPKMALIFLSANILFMMVLISIKRGVLLV